MKVFYGYDKPWLLYTMGDIFIIMFLLVHLVPFIYLAGLVLLRCCKRLNKNYLIMNID
jgi:hypothetical protein